MGDPVAVLVVAVAGLSDPLLAHGVCGAMPPRFINDDRHEDDGGGWGPWDDDLFPIEVALVLWLDGALVPEGWDRLRRVLSGRGMAFRATPPDAMTCEIAAAVALSEGLASRVVLLDRHDGRLVERAP